MKETNNLFIILGIIILFSLSSCKTTSIVNYESEQYEQFKQNSDCLYTVFDEFYFSRIMTTVYTDLIIKRFSKNNVFPEIKIENIIIKDDSENIVFQKKEMHLKPNGINHVENGYNYQIYSYKMSDNELNRNVLRNLKTKFIIMMFEINGKTYSEKLNRVETRYVITQT